MHASLHPSVEGVRSTCRLKSSTALAASYVFSLEKGLRGKRLRIDTRTVASQETCFGECLGAQVGTAATRQDYNVLAAFSAPA